MKKYFIIIAIAFCSISVNAQVLTVSEVTQEQNQWCWAGCTACILAHYGYYVSQCNIAEYARSVITWTTSYGTTNCCVNPNLGCNYWNYNWGYAGSIQDILQHFHNIVNTGVNATLTTTQIATDLAANHVFVEHWAWTTGGGHFVVGYGLSGTGTTASIYYMNPWPGEGLSIGSYSWMQTGTNDMGDHTWDATNVVTSFPPVNGVQQVSQSSDNDIIYPNPSTGEFTVKGEVNNEIEVLSITGEPVYNVVMKNETEQINLQNLAKGMYIVKISAADGNKFSKLVLQ